MRRLKAKARGIFPLPIGKSNTPVVYPPPKKGKGTNPLVPEHIKALGFECCLTSLDNGGAIHHSQDNCTFTLNVQSITRTSKEGVYHIQITIEREQKLLEYDKYSHSGHWID